MGDLTKNFSREEFECECGCEFDTVDYRLVTVLQATVNYFEDKYNAKVRCVITSGNRCLEHDEETQKKYDPDYIPGTSKSQHKDAKAADVKFQLKTKYHWVEIEPEEVYERLDETYTDEIGLGIYHNRCHVDVRGYKARWKG